MTFAIFHDFPGLENGLPKFPDFPWPGGTLIATYLPVTVKECSLCIELTTNKLSTAWKTDSLVQMDGYTVKKKLLEN